MVPTLTVLLILAQCGGACDAVAPHDIPTPSPDPPPDVRLGHEAQDPAAPTLQPRLLQRTYDMGGRAMNRGLVPFGDQVLVVAQPSDDRTPQHIVAVDAEGRARYLRRDGVFGQLPREDGRLEDAAVLRGEGIEADYADGLLALLNSDSLSDWTDSGFLDWGSGIVPSGAPAGWSTRVPLVWRESHQRTVAVLDAGAQGTLLVGHVGRNVQDRDGRQPTHFPSAMVSTDRGRTWTWGPMQAGQAPPVGAYAAAWPGAPGGSAILYFATTLPGDNRTPPLAIFRPSRADPSGVALDVPYASRMDLWGAYEYREGRRSFVPNPIRHWVTRWGLFLDTNVSGLFRLSAPDELPVRVENENPDFRGSQATLYFAHQGDLHRVTPIGTVERLADPTGPIWSLVGTVERPAHVTWTHAAASDAGALWLLGHRDGDVTIATWSPGEVL